MQDNWIWLPASRYPNRQTTRYDAMSRQPDDTYTVAEFKRSYDFGKPIESVSLRIGGDTEFQLFCCGSLLATGPATVGGDFLGNGRPRAWYYVNEMTFTPEGTTLDFFARVKMMPVLICEFSRGRGGFMLRAEVRFADGSTETVTTDESWLVRYNGAYAAPLRYDGTVSPDDYVPAEPVADVWSGEVAPIPVREEWEIPVGVMTLAPGETLTAEFPLDKIYAGFLHLSAETAGVVEGEFQLRELEEKPRRCEQVSLAAGGDYRGFLLHSAGNVLATVTNRADSPSTLRISLIATAYPVTAVAFTETDDEALNRVLEVCRHTLRICRQTHHLDSPRHCEPLACTGDYYIESLMTAFSFGDMRLAEFDVLRTAELLRHNDGRMFHTTYSLIWVRMLYDVYMIGGRPTLLADCLDALGLLLNRFTTYLGENGLIDNPPDYMFVDWIYIDGISLHHPPKCLGQTVLNMFYYMALDYAARIYTAVGDADAAADCRARGEALRTAVNTLLYDEARGMYFEGLNTPTPEEKLYRYMPANTDRRYYLKQSNILAAYTGICSDGTARMLLDKIMRDEIPGDVQPYFMHYLFEAIFAHGLRETYTRTLLERWKAPTAACPKGLVEGFITPEPTYSFDHSHAWGGTPLWSLPRALLGLTVDAPGLREITLSPSLLGFARARVELPTACGTVVCEMEAGSPPRVSAPAGITVHLGA